MEEDAAEARVRAACDAKRFEQATAAAIDAYGAEVFSFLIGRMRAEDTASDVFSQTCEDLWRSMAEFEWRCSMRTWFYRLARNAAVRHERSPANRAGRRVGISQVSELVERVRSNTLPHLRSEMKDELRKLRNKLDPEEQSLLILRIDRDLSWNEIAAIMADEDGGDAHALTRASARLRQRFQKLKDRLRELAIAEGLIQADG